MRWAPKGRTWDSARVARLFPMAMWRRCTGSARWKACARPASGLWGSRRRREKSRSRSRQAEWICERMIDAGLDRKAWVVALGGGVVGDLAGFVAAIYYRGVPYVQAPTTIVAQVDSAVGGKTGVNARNGKNLIGAFHQPRLVLADVDTLGTLPQREFNEGFAEVIKHGAIRDRKLLDRLPVSRADQKSLAPIIQRNVEIKAAIVAADERETTGERALLNFGHTIGHADRGGGGVWDAAARGGGEPRTGGGMQDIGGKGGARSGGGAAGDLAARAVSPAGAIAGGDSGGDDPCRAQGRQEIRGRGDPFRPLSAPWRSIRLERCDNRGYQGCDCRIELLSRPCNPPMYRHPRTDRCFPFPSEVC